MGLNLFEGKRTRLEQHQQTMVNWLLGADHSLVETTIAYEQVAIEVTAAPLIELHTMVASSRRDTVPAPATLKG
ncbi:MAG: hypothetical protein ACREUG_14175, partial [Steroidobacteraceae bacterium]